MPKFTIQETCTYEVEAESMEDAKTFWLTGGKPTDPDAGDVWEVMKKSFCGVTDRNICCNEPDDKGVIDDTYEIF